MTSRKTLEKEIAELKKKLRIACNHEQGLVYSCRDTGYTDRGTGKKEYVYIRACRICGFEHFMDEPDWQVARWVAEGEKIEKELVRLGREADSVKYKLETAKTKANQ